ncbi:methyltransferase, FkbM family [Alkalispirochaeta americana]|uniref:Methyltransferase, FkbM family n=1 Tax=Alkalispirochaeta americana TaxID=159291 RepID=A0A1N6TUN2_9SPIO|nr:FkbM family methyltransferase [Alkalispirochaeta americana]SIQ57029.1 methyltransferase, FkbM family [Alkalispirochaeta americana]
MKSSNGEQAGIDGYDDIHENLRYWMNELVGAVPSGRAVIYDIGANDGELTLPFARKPHKVIAFEPGRAARERLLQRVSRQADLQAFTLLPCALGRQPGRAVLDVYSDDTFSSLHERSREDLQRYGLAVTGTEEVTVLALDGLTGVCQKDTRGTGTAESDQTDPFRQALAGVLKEALPSVPEPPLPPPDVVKIDVEGAERDVLEGALETLRDAAPAVVMEYSCVNTAHAGYDRRELLDLLRRAGYRKIFGLYRNKDRRLYGEEAFEDCRIWNIIAFSDRFALPLARAELGTDLPS